MNYLFLLLPISLFILSYSYNAKVKKLKNSGKIPVIAAAQRNRIIFLVLAVTTVFAFILLFGVNWD
jgi:hypothetical protein